MILGKCKCGKIGKVDEEVHQVLMASEENSNVTLNDFICNKCLSEYQMFYDNQLAEAIKRKQMTGK